MLEWFNPGCPFVQKHYTSDNMQKLQKAVHRQGCRLADDRFLGRGKEGYLTPEAANKQIADWKMKPTALLLDPTGKVGHEYAATNTPHMYVIDPEGKADLLRRDRRQTIDQSRTMWPARRIM